MVDKALVLRKLAELEEYLGQIREYRTWVERFSVHGSGLKRPNWLLAKGNHVDRYKCYVSPNG